MPRRTRRSISGIATVMLTASLGLAACEKSPLGESGAGAPSASGGDGSTAESVPPPGDSGASSGQGEDGSGETVGPPPGSQNPGAAKDRPETDASATVQLITRAARGPVGGFARTLLGEGAAGSIVVVALVQPGAEIADSTLSRVVELLGQASGKPTSLRQVTLPEGGASTWSAEELIRLADERGGSPQGEEGRAVLHLALVHGSFEGGDSVLGVAVRGDVAAIFVDRVRDSATLLVPRGPIEEAVVVHETGHLLGLVDLALDTGREDPEHPGHSRSQDSVMYWAVESNLIAELLGAGPPTDFDDADRADLAALRSGR